MSGPVGLRTSQELIEKNALSLWKWSLIWSRKGADKLTLNLQESGI